MSAKINVHTECRNQAMRKAKKILIVILANILLASAGTAVAHTAEQMQRDRIIEELREIRGLLEEVLEERRIDDQTQKPSSDQLVEEDEAPTTSTGSQPTKSVRIKPVEADMTLTGRPMLGQVDAPVTLVEFTDLQCPFCARFFRQSLSDIKDRYIDSGKLKLVVKNLPLPMHSDAKNRAEVALCAKEQGKYWPVHNAFFNLQDTVNSLNIGDYAEELEIDMEAIQRCTESDKYVPEIEQDIKEAKEIGVKSPPAKPGAYSGSASKAPITT